MRAQELAILAGYGIHVPAHVEYIGMTGLAADAAPWRVNFALAMDAQPGLVTAPNAGVPAFLTNLLDPEVVRVLVTPMKAAEVYGETKKGDWTTLTTQFPIVERTGEVTSYGDYNNNGNAGANINWVARQSYHFQTVSQWGERELDMYGVAKINYASEVNAGSALALAKFLNRSYLFGITGLANYGALNDPSLNAPMNPGVKAAGGYTWDAGTANEIYDDVLSLFGQLQTQMAGNVPDMQADLTLVMSPILAVKLKKRSLYNVSAEEAIKASFPNLKIETIPEMTTQAGELMQLILNTVDGTRTTYAAFTEKMRAHPVIPDLSSYKQKKSGGTWGTIIRRPIAIASMLGM